MKPLFWMASRYLRSVAKANCTPQTWRSSRAVDVMLFTMSSPGKTRAHTNADGWVALSNLTLLETHLISKMLLTTSSNRLALATAALHLALHKRVMSRLCFNVWDRFLGLYLFSSARCIYIVYGTNGIWSFDECITPACQKKTKKIKPTLTEFVHSCPDKW